jgi:hypothetical protein
MPDRLGAYSRPRIFMQHHYMLTPPTGRARPHNPSSRLSEGVLCTIVKRTSENLPSRDCLENSWTDRIERFLVAQSVEKEAFHPVPRALGITKWSLFRVSRQSLHALR